MDIKYSDNYIEQITEEDFQFSPEDQTMVNLANFRATADYTITPLQDAVDIGIATEEEITRLKQWKIYRVQLSRVPQQSGYPDKIEWPEQPNS